ncbi:MAG: hypothetical protein LBQ83_02380 [Candidatus Margulisbacteria bacterium]|jgi:hypothetical protein|nr:hypothetical protein [Candidatus Margulisiibacteriota bacterium]
MSRRLKLAVFFMLISLLGNPPLVIIVTPFLPFSLKIKGVLLTGWILFGQITWWIGLLIGGAEAVARRQELLVWLKKFRGCRGKSAVPAVEKPR